ncbi:tRNA (adenosine(37)-N6)-dimethylallyltransferase MiaA [Porticoccaceae bacterium]|nr:tRNA (adenosine(37)-N6)-dimethylallyltransferase MiaA [Porticoccaceae bacterium]
MTDKKLPVIFIMGPTASGKTDLAIALRDHMPVELINVDSAQIYDQMDIGTAKPDIETLTRAPHRLLGFCDPADSYSAADFAQDAKKEISEIHKLGRIPVLVGGSMLYFKVLLEGMSDLPAADAEIRNSIQRQADIEGWSSLHAELAKVDPKSAERLHPNHSQRIQRALEVYRITGVSLSDLQQQSEGGIEDTYDVQQYALIPQNRALLHQRIEQRFTAMMEAGFEDEVKKLFHRGDLHSDMPSIRAAGYSQLWSFLEGQVSLDEAVERAIIATRQLSKRQQTWLRNWPNCQQIAVDDGSHFYSTKMLCENLLKLK